MSRDYYHKDSSLDTDLITSSTDSIGVSWRELYCHKKEVYDVSSSSPLDFSASKWPELLNITWGTLQLCTYMKPRALCTFSGDCDDINSYISKILTHDVFANKYLAANDCENGLHLRIN